MSNKSQIAKVVSSIQESGKTQWCELERRVRLGIALPKEGEASYQDICAALMGIDPVLQRLGISTFDYWTTTHGYGRQQVGYVQTYRDLRIIDTRLVFQVQEQHGRLKNVKRYNLVPEEGSFEAIEHLGKNK